ncbi:MAG: Glu-tRNA(Gln) amidotransferase subunit GatE [Nanoarchaeota archaeon]|mgnify:CR=1 FL=1
MNYQELGFKSGIEIHQQLEGYKLFCNCPCLVNDPNPPDILIKRKLRTTASELGKIDQAAAFEMQRDRTFIYEACSTSSCLVETDDEPPHQVNKHALEAAMQVASLMKCKMVRHIQFMRKVVIDGSNLGAFQRTALIAYDGKIETSKGQVKIESVCLEEESAKKIEEREREVMYRLDRLGIPLIEIATDASLQDPEHVREAAAIIGMILRSTEHVKHGLGSIRQDINISIKGHPRVELKGFQDLRSIPKTVENEVKRQIENLKGKKIMGEVRKVNPDFTSTFLRPMPGAERMYPETDIPLVHITNEDLKKIVLPELLTERIIKLEKKYKLNPELARKVIEMEYFEDFVAAYPKLESAFIAHTLIETPKEITARYHLNGSKLARKDFTLIFDALQSGKIPKSAILEILIKILKDEEVNLNNYAILSDKELEGIIKQVIAQNKGAPFNALMGESMKVLKGRSEGKKVAEIIRRYS